MATRKQDVTDVTNSQGLRGPASHTGDRKNNRQSSRPSATTAMTNSMAPRRESNPSLDPGLLTLVNCESLTPPRHMANSSASRSWGTGAQAERGGGALRPRAQPIAPCHEDFLKYGMSHKTGKTLSPLGEGRSVEWRMLRAPLDREEGLCGQQEGNEHQQHCAPSHEVHLKNSGHDKAGKTYQQRRTPADGNASNEQQ